MVLQAAGMTSADVRTLTVEHVVDVPVESVKMAGGQLRPTYYDLSGRRVAQPRDRGLYIRRTTKGNRTKKVLVK